MLFSFYPEQRLNAPKWTCVAMVAHVPSIGCEIVCWFCQCTPSCKYIETCRLNYFDHVWGQNPWRHRVWEYEFGRIRRLLRIKKKITSAIGQHLLENPECANTYSDELFSFVARGRNDLQLSILESLFIQTHRPVLCKQKEYLYKSKLFKLLL